MYFNILKIPFYDNQQMCHSYVYSIRPNELFQTQAMREKYNDLYNLLITKKIDNVSGFHNYSQNCYYILCVPSIYTLSTQTKIAKNDDILYVYDFLSSKGYNIQTKDYRQSFHGYSISKHFGEIIATLHKA